MLTRSGLKLLDFGIAKQQVEELGSTPPMNATETAFDTIDGTLIGTVPYMAPEQLELKAIDARTDIFAFGCVLFEMATGRRAFCGRVDRALVAAILADSRPVASKAAQACPAVSIASSRRASREIRTTAASTLAICFVNCAG
jgi:serine/threonine protein kinase